MKVERVKVNFNIDKDLWESFRKICKWHDLTASQKLRKFIRDTVLAEEELSESERGKMEKHFRKLGYIK